MTACILYEHVFIMFIFCFVFQEDKKIDDIQDEDNNLDDAQREMEIQP